MLVPMRPLIVLAACLVALGMLVSVPHRVGVYSEVEQLQTGRIRRQEITVSAPLWGSLDAADVREAVHDTIPGHYAVFAVMDQSPDWGPIVGRLAVLLLLTGGLLAVVSYRAH